MQAAGLLTSDEFLALPMEYDASGNRVKDELVRGEVITTPTSSKCHDVIKNNIGEALTRYLRSNPQLGLRSLIEIAWRVSDYDTLVPDVSVLNAEQLADEESRILIGAPEIAIEVVSPSDTASYIKNKVGAYLAAGAYRVWVVFPEDRSVIIYTTDYYRELKLDQHIDDPLLPGFSTSVSSFFEQV
jgi:Uma2 family endonuclease